MERHPPELEPCLGRVSGVARGFSPEGTERLCECAYVCGARGCVLGLPGSPSVYERAVSMGAQIEFLNDSPVLVGAFKKRVLNLVSFHKKSS